MTEWTYVKLSDCCDILDSKRIPINGVQRSKISGNIPYYGANGIKGYINKYIFDDDLILIAEDGGNFETYATRPIAYRVSGKSWVNNHAHVLKSKPQFDQNFIYYSQIHNQVLDLYNVPLFWDLP